MVEYLPSMVKAWVPAQHSEEKKNKGSSLSLLLLYIQQTQQGLSRKARMEVALRNEGKGIAMVTNDKGPALGTPSSRPAKLCKNSWLRTRN